MVIITRGRDNRSEPTGDDLGAWFAQLQNDGKRIGGKIYKRPSKTGRLGREDQLDLREWMDHGGTLRA